MAGKQLSQVTDHDLLRSGLVTIFGIESFGSVMPSSKCGILDPQHVWSKAKDDIAEEPTYQSCTKCGSVRRSPWGLVDKTGHEVSLAPMDGDERMAKAWPAPVRRAMERVPMSL